MEVRAGTAVRKYMAVMSDGPVDHVFQSIRDGKPIRDNNILTRFIKPAGRKIDAPWVNWRCLRTSHATWLKLAGRREGRAGPECGTLGLSTLLDIYQQFVSESQYRVVEKLSNSVSS